MTYGISRDLGCGTFTTIYFKSTPADTWRAHIAALRRHKEKLEASLAECDEEIALAESELEKLQP